MKNWEGEGEYSLLMKHRMLFVIESKAYFLNKTLYTLLNKRNIPIVVSVVSESKIHCHFTVITKKKIFFDSSHSHSFHLNLFFICSFFSSSLFVII